MTTVNAYYIGAILSPFFWLGEAGTHDNLDLNDEGNARAMIRDHLKPEYASFDPKSRDITKESLRYFLNKPGFPWEELFYAPQPPFSAPDDIRQFFVWLWEELFPGESFHLDSLKGYRERNDLEAPNRIIQTRKPDDSKQ